MDTNPSTTDIYLLDADWSDEQKAVIAAVRRFVDDEVLPVIGMHHDKETFPAEIFAKMAGLGIFETIAEGAMDPIAYGLIARELDRGSATLRSILSVQGSLVMGAIGQFGSDEQKARWLPAMGRMEAIGCFGLTEPDFGSNPAGMESRAERIEGGYRITGRKSWITNGTLAHVAVIWAKLDGRVTGFLVETDRPGFEARRISGKWSFRASDTAQLFLDGVEIPEGNRLPGAGSLGAAIACLNNARYGIVWGVAGCARACIEETTAYLLERTQFEGKPLASHQLVQNKLAWMAAETTAMECLAKRLGELKRDGRLEPHMVSLAKMNNCRKAIEIARTCRELLGANGISNEYHIGRRMVDLETVLTYEGTEHIHSLVLGQHMTGLKAYS